MVQLTVLAESEVEAIHQASLKILSEVGICISHPKAIELLSGAGAARQDDRVLLPPELVEKAISLCPHSVSISGRKGSRIMLGDHNLHWHNLGGARDLYDHRNGQKRPARLQDVRDSTRLLDALGEVTSITPLFTPQDVPGELMSLAMYRHSLAYTTKPLQGPGVQTPEEVRLAVQMASVVGDPSKILTLSVSPVSPLIFSDHIVGAILEIASQGIGFAPLPCPTAGATAPLSLAGAQAQQNAEILACIVLAQLTRPGLPIVYCGRLAMMEPRTVTSVWGGVELGLASAASVQVGHHYGLPVNVYGFSTNALIPGLQSGFERAFNAIIPALAGADELSGIGEMQAGVSSSLAQIVCDNEIAAGVRRLRRGFSVNDDALAVGLIGKVMNETRNFLDQSHTVRYLRSGEILITQLAERRSWDEWETDGRKSMVDRAQDEVERILAEHHVEPLDPDQERELDEIMLQAEEILVRT